MKNKYTCKYGIEATKTQLKTTSLYWQREITKLSIHKLRKSWKNNQWVLDSYWKSNRVAWSFWNNQSMVKNVHNKTYSNILLHIVS